MIRYLSVLTYTDQGIKDLSDSPQRAQQFRSAIEKAGGRMLVQYWVIGEYDGCFVFEAPDEATATRLLLDLGRKGNVRTRTMRVLDETEFRNSLP